MSRSIAVVAVVIIIFLLGLQIVKFRRWPEGRKRALRSKKKKHF